MAACLLPEIELPGRTITRDTLQIIAHRYHWAAQFIAGKEVLEVCCGPGLGFGWLSGHAHRVIGGDITEASLDVARRHYGNRGRFIRIDAHRLPFADESHDAVICLAAIIYLAVPSFVAECRRVLKPGGVLLLNSPNKDQPNFHPSALSRRYYSVPELDAILREQRFNTEFFGAFPAPPPPAAGWSSGAGARHAVKAVLRLLGLLGFIRKLRGQQTPPLVLHHELGTKEMRLAEKVPVVPISAAVPNHTYRIVYAVATPSRE